MKALSRFVLAAALPALLHAGLITPNLLTNPGAETGDLTGWTQGGVSTPGVDNGAFDPGINPHSGTWDFYGHTGGNGTLSQTQSILVNGITAGQIDAGGLFANVTFWEQGLNQGTPSDDAFISLVFLNGSSSVISTVNTMTIDSHLGAWTSDAENFAIPTGTRSITYVMNFIRNQGGDNDSFIDDNSLTISSSAVQGTPEPSTMALVLTGLAAAVARRFRKR